MGECDQCGETIGMPYTCERCDASLCSSHRLPEKHYCGALNTDSDAPQIDGDGSLIIGIVFLPFYAAYRTGGFILNVGFSLLSRPIPLLLVLTVLVGTGAFVGVIPVGDAVDSVSEWSDDSLNVGASTPGEDTESGADDVGISRQRVENKIAVMINNNREDSGASSLQLSGAVSEAAREHSQDMYERDFYAHENPDGEEPWDRVAHTSVCSRSDGDGAENIHRGGTYEEMNSLGSPNSYYTNDAESVAAYVVDGWMHSKGHRENMLNNRWSHVGIGVHIEDGTFHATAVFC